MAAQTIDVKLNLLAQQAAKDLAAIDKSLGEVEQSEGEVESAGKIMARTLSASADAIEADFLDSRAAADALANALGPEMAAKIGQNGIDKMVADLKNAGLTTDQIKADVNELAGAIQHLDDVGKTMTVDDELKNVGTAADDAKGHIGGMKGEADQSRSVLANMVGNSTQDLAGLGGVAGTAGMALGQMGEYATEGGISLAGLARVAGPMAAVTVVSLGIQKVLGDIAKIRAFDKKQVEDWREAIKNSTPPAEHLRDILTETGKIEFHDPISDDIRDIVPVLDDAGISVAQFTTLVEGGLPAIQEMDAKLTAAGVVTADVGRIFSAAIDIHKKHQEAVEQEAIVQRVLADDMGETEREQRRLEYAYVDGTDALGDLSTATDDQSNASKSLTTQLDRQRAKQEEVTSAERAAVDKKYAYRESTERAEEAVANLTTVLDDNKSSQEDVEQATDDAASAIIDQSADYATLKGATLDSKEGIDRQIDSLTLTAAALAPGSPLRANIEEYIKDLKNIPTEINTTLSVTQLGIIDKGGYIPGYKGPQASGGLFLPRPGGWNVTVAEAGQPEVLTPLDKFLELVAHGVGGTVGGGTTIINNFPPGIDPVSVAVANRKYARRGGR